MKPTTIAWIGIALGLLATANARAETAAKEPPVLLTPAAPHQPRINGPKVYGLRPGSPLIYRIPATGDRPMTFSAEGPAGRADARSRQRHPHRPREQARHVPRHAVGRQRPGPGQTACCGWWSATGWPSRRRWAGTVGTSTTTASATSCCREAADQMVATGMADYGYQYVNIDDCWAVEPGSRDPVVGGPVRDASGRMLPNRRFPDMKALTDYIHAKGLKAGIYTSPGPHHLRRLRRQLRPRGPGRPALSPHWGFDFLKYDWCSYDGVAGRQVRLAALQKPYG